MRCGFDPWVMKVPCRRKWQPSPVFLRGKFHGQRSLAGYSPWGRKGVEHDSWLKQHIQQRQMTKKGEDVSGWALSLFIFFSLYFIFPFPFIIFFILVTSGFIFSCFSSSIWCKVFRLFEALLVFWSRPLQQRAYFGLNKQKEEYILRSFSYSNLGFEYVLKKYKFTCITWF